MNGIEYFKSVAPETFDSYMMVIKSLQERCPFDVKTKELMLIGILTAKEADNGLRTHVERAIKAGADHNEIATVIISALPSCGMTTVMKALNIAKECLEQNGLLEV